jgi:hypothetical protein
MMDLTEEEEVEETVEVANTPAAAQNRGKRPLSLTWNFFTNDKEPQKRNE